MNIFSLTHYKEFEFQQGTIKIKSNHYSFTQTGAPLYTSLLSNQWATHMYSALNACYPRLLTHAVLHFKILVVYNVGSLNLFCCCFWASFKLTVLVNFILNITSIFLCFYQWEAIRKRLALPVVWHYWDVKWANLHHCLAALFTQLQWLSLPLSSQLLLFFFCSNITWISFRFLTPWMLEYILQSYSSFYINKSYIFIYSTCWCVGYLDSPKSLQNNRRINK